MRIAICDDDSLELARISSYIDAYRRESNASLAYSSFQSAAELISHVKSGAFSLILLDIMMPGINGMEAAQEIRTFDTGVKIIFLTSSPEYAVESYTVRAYDYILKPVSKDKLFSVLDAVIADERIPLEGFTVKTQKGMVRILFSKLAYVEIINKKLYFHMADGNFQEVNSSLAAFEEKLLARPEFVKIHRSYIVNMYYISMLGSKELVISNGKTLPISRALYGNVKEAYMKHLFLEKGVE
ncbi:MAG: response regulator transcription factor [Clostridiaceae bacterium]|nr:response regulator transcription factor [Clostridiaceae bacterium]